ncbi:MAG: hypothetical protein ACREF7_01250 [Candidatus Saccharimonadales bacterium]
MISKKAALTHNYSAAYYYRENGTPKLMTTTLGEHTKVEAKDLALDLVRGFDITLDRVEIYKTNHS